jgi:hypothetical protein
MKLKAGTLVEVRSRDEILRTLDADGAHEKMPFMPEMLRYCGKQFRVAAVAHKTCDSAYKTGGRRLENAVHLEDLRCDGSAHGGCQATCLLFWKTPWLKVVDAGAGDRNGTADGSRGVSEDQLLAATVKRGTDSTEPIYVCQATQLYHATTLLPWWDVRQFWRDIRYGNVSIGRAARVLTVAMFRWMTTLGFGYRIAVWMYKKAHLALNGFPAPLGNGLIPRGQPTPTCHLGLNPGEMVRVRSHDEIKHTISTGNKNRGMWFDHEMVKFSGHTYRVARRVDQIIDEVSGKMLKMKEPCVVLDKVWCTAEYTDSRLLCRRAVTTYWRENWLERGDAGAPQAVPPDSARRETDRAAKDL